jgi:hypothetical protein
VLRRRAALRGGIDLVENALAKLWRRWFGGRPIIVASGLPRSGTSMLMRMLAAGGIELVVDGARPADTDNPLGYFELERVKRLDRDPDRSWLRGARGKALKVVSPLLRHLPREQRYRVVLMLRSLDEVIASQNQMLERRGEPNPVDDARTRELYTQHLDEVRRMLDARPEIEWIELRHDEAIADPRASARRLRAFLGTGDADSMARAVDPSLHRNRGKDRDGVPV